MGSDGELEMDFAGPTSYSPVLLKGCSAVQVSALLR